MPTCEPVRGATAAEALALSVQDGTIAVAHQRDGYTTLTMLDADLDIRWTKTKAKHIGITTLARGTRAGSAVVVSGLDDGVTLVRSAASGGMRAELAPSTAPGHFSFMTGVPGGGFFGTHMLVATLSWEGPTGEQSARFVDWFHVVDTDGAPIDMPAYDVILLAYQQDAPMGEYGQPR